MYQKMKKVLASLLVLFVLMVSVPLAAEACPRHRRHVKRSTTSRSYAPRYRTAGYAYRDNRTFYQRHRDKVNLGIGAGAGALIGGLTKGRKGALIGGLIGGGGAALYTYVLNPKKKRRY